MYDRIIVGTDGSTTATRAVETAARVARAHNATLVVASAYVPKLTQQQKTCWEQTPEDARWRLSAGAMAEAVVEQAVDHALATAGTGLDVVSRAEPGDAVDVMLDLVTQVDASMLVVGNRPRPGLRRLRGSVAGDLSRRAACDVLVVDTVGRGKPYRHP